MSRPVDVRLSFNEVAPGTGQATKDLLARGASVHAIEIGPAMTARLDPPLGGIIAVVDLIQVDSPDDGGFFAAAAGGTGTRPPAPLTTAV